MFNTVKPTGKQAVDVKLWYIGGFANKNVKLTAKGNFYVTPEEGEYLTVPQFIANDLIRRNRNQKGQSVFTKDAAFAKAIVARRNSPVVEEEPQMTREQLLAKLAELEANEEKEDAAPVIPVRKSKAAEKEAALSKEGEI